MYHIKYLALFLLALILFNACSNEEKYDIDKDKKYFSLKHFFQKEVKRLDKNFTKLNKKVKLNEKQESKFLTEIDWENELGIFANADLNKPAWEDKYQIDSLIKGNQLKITYTALEEKLKTQKIEVLFKDKRKRNPQRINIQNANKNVIYQSHETLEYIPTEGYVITNKQKVKGQAEEVFGIEGRFE